MVVHCYLELHIEQGASLERQGLPIGVVEGIVAIARYSAPITGVANHAGTTAMPDRQDALVAASQVVLAVRDVVTSRAGPPGRHGRACEVPPNAANVVPGEASLSIELRDLPKRSSCAWPTTSLDERRRSRRQAGRRSSEPGRWLRGCDGSASMQSIVARPRESLALKHETLPSGAGHDAQMMATLGPMGMIFMPSIGGISHSPRERMSGRIAHGADTLLQAVVLADRERF